MKNLPLHNVDILEKFLKDYTLNKKYMAEKDDFEILKFPLCTECTCVDQIIYIIIN